MGGGLKTWEVVSQWTCILATERCRKDEILGQSVNDLSRAHFKMGQGNCSRIDLVCGWCNIMAMLSQLYDDVHNDERT